MSARQLFYRQKVYNACDLALRHFDEFNQQAFGPVYRRGEIVAIKNWALADWGEPEKVELTFEMFVAIPPEAWRMAGVLS